MAKGKGYDIGTVRTRKDDRKYKKIAPNKWRLVYESESREDEGGGSKSRDDKWFRQVLNEEEFKQYIKDVRDGKKPGNALIGMVSESSKAEVKTLTGVDVTKSIIEEGSVIHTDDPKHLLDPDDILKNVEVINNPVSIKLSPEKSKQVLDVIIFEGNINGKIFFVEVVHPKHKGWLSLKTAYRPKKASAVPQWSKDPGANVQNAPPLASNSSISQSPEKSSDFEKILVEKSK